MPKKAVPEGWSKDHVIDHEMLYGVTPEMLDWWWDNIEKGMPLWHPTSHKWFIWEVSPGKVGHIGAIHVGEQIVEGSLMRNRSRREDVSFADPSMIIYDHVEVDAAIDANNKNTGRYIVHQYEATDYGTRMRSIFHSPEPAPPTTNRHSEEETARFPHFLPELYKLWQVVTDREINPHFRLKVKKLPNGKYAYVEKVKL